MISKDFQIREATIADKKIVSYLACELWPNHAESELEEELEVFLKAEDQMILLAFNAEEAIGFAHCQLRNDYVEGTSTTPVGYLEGIYVKEKWRFQGIASAFIQHLENWALMRGCQEFASDCEIDNQDSLNFHLQLGFKEVNRVICFNKRLGK